MRFPLRKIKKEIGSEIRFREFSAVSIKIFFVEALGTVFEIFRFLTIGRSVSRSHSFSDALKMIAALLSPTTYMVIPKN